jgi:CubicO group peptidase (beta-lactamase class C family)
MLWERWVSRVVVATGVVVGGCSDSGSDSGGENPDGSDDIRALNDEVRRAVEQSLGQGFATAYSVAVWKDGRVIYAKAFGEKDEGGAAVTPETLFQIGSDAKKITALALLREVEAGTVELDDTVADILPDLDLASEPGYFETVTVRDLLRQTTGLYDYTPFSNAPDDSDLEDIIHGRFAENEVVLMPSGIAHRYSNPNYALAGLITEVLQGRPWADVVTEDVLAPLGLTHTHARLADVLASETDVASGFGVRTPVDTFDPFEVIVPVLGWVAPEEQFDNAFARPAGLVWSTAAEQAALLGFFVDGDPSVLSDELRREMMTEQAPTYNHSHGIGYGYGLSTQSFYPSHLRTFHDMPFVWHDGGTLTMTSLSGLLPEQRVAVSVLANGFQEDLALVAGVALEAAVGGPLPSRIGRPDALLGTPSDDLSAYAGSFTDPNYGEITISFVDDRLEMEVPRLAELGTTIGSMQPVGNDLFLVEADGQLYDISFYDGPDGEPHQYGVNRQFVLTRVR